MRRLVATATVLLCMLAAAGCGDDTEAAAGGGSDDVKTIEVTFEGGTVTPNGERVEVEAGQPVDLVVEADRPGEIHVHSTPEKEFSYDAGTTTIELEVERPGVVEVESHDLEQVIVQLEVR